MLDTQSDNAIEAEIATVFNDIVQNHRDFSQEVSRVGTAIENLGVFEERVNAPYMKGSWNLYTEQFNKVVESLVLPTKEVIEVISAVADGQLEYILETGPGDYGKLRSTINHTLSKLRAFTWEVMRVISNVGIQSELGAQAHVEGLGGVWRALTDHVNDMSANLTEQVRAIAEVTTAVARGDLSKKMTADAKVCYN